jgi:hypothetical protein
MLDDKFLSWLTVWVKFFDNFFHSLFFDFVKGLLLHFLNLLNIFLVRHNFNFAPPLTTCIEYPGASQGAPFLALGMPALLRSVGQSGKDFFKTTYINVANFG